MLLVVGVLLLVLIVGMTYMHVVQEDRRAGLTVDIDAIVLSVVDVASEQLLADLAVNSSGVPFAADERNNTTGAVGADGIIDQEPFDYPGPLDKWLGSTAPDGATPQWSQVSLFGDAFTNGGTTQTLNATDVTNATSKAHDQPADADGDGIIDSQSQPAPIQSRGGLLFYMWVRMQDSSALANVNVWHSQVDSAGAYDATATGTDAPRSWYPGELNLGGVVYGHANYANRFPEMQALMTIRGVNNAERTPWGIGTAGQRGNSWLFGGKFYGNPQGSYTSLHLDTGDAFDPSNELELRHRNGLIYLDTEAGIESSTALHTLLRGNKTQAERSWDDSAVAIPGATSIANYFALEPRHRMTTYSGIANYRPYLAGDTAPYTRRDLNVMLTGATPAADIAAEVFAVYNGAPAAVIPSGLTAQQFADQFAVNIIDYGDGDNRLSEYVGTSGTVYGMEALPFLCEVYSQAKYAATVATDNGNGTWNTTWTRTGRGGYAIEIRNPFRKPISLADVHLYIGGTDWGQLSTLMGQATMAPKQAFVIYRRSNNDGAGALNDPSNLVTGGNLVQVTPVTEWPSNDGDVVVELRAKKQDGTQLTWAYSKTNNAYGMPVTINDPAYVSVANPTGTAGWRYGTSLGNGDRLNMVTVSPTDFVATGRVASPNVDTTYAPTESLGIGVKPSGPSVPIPVADLDSMQWIVADNGTPPITQVGDFVFIPAIGPSSTQTIGDVWGATTQIKDYMVKPGNLTVVGTATTPDNDVPHAVLLMDRLTTLDPRQDGVDNDGDGAVDNAEELLIPGVLNLNTASRTMLFQALPILGGNNRRTATVDAIIAYRDNSGGDRPGTHRPGRKGIAFVGETFNLSSLASVYNPRSDGIDDMVSNGTIADFVSNPAAGTADGIIDDREEAAMLMRSFMQTCSTRSDIYTAYILVRGYSPADLTKPATERRAVVLLDRSRIASADDGVRVLGILWY